MQEYQHKVIHVHVMGMYVVFKKLVALGSEGFWLHVQDCVHDDFGNLVVMPFQFNTWYGE